VIDDATFGLLNVVYLKKLASIEDLASLTAAPVDDVDDVIAGLSERELVVSTPSGVLLSGTGRDLVVDYYQRAYEPLRSNVGLVSWYEQFEDLNTRFIALVSEWQHTNGDARVHERLLRVVGSLVRELDQLVPSIPRYEGYANRFNLSLARVDAGNDEYIANPRLDSLHNIWFEFHEDILSVLGRPRDTT
jgi:hypothetical protein